MNETADVALQAVLMPSSAGGEAPEDARRVRGPSRFDSLVDVMESYSSIGFQASHLSHAIHIARKALQRQQRSRQFAVRDGAFVEVTQEEERRETVRPLWFLGATAQLLGTACREAIIFLLQEGLEPRRPVPPPKEEGDDRAETRQHFGYELYTSLGLRDLRQEADAMEKGAEESDDEGSLLFYSFLSCLVVSGGGMEHDIRRACMPYRLTHYSSEGKKDEKEQLLFFGNVCHQKFQREGDAPPPPPPTTTTGDSPYRDDGEYGARLFHCVMTMAVKELKERQARLRAMAAASPPPSDPYFDVCQWNITPSEVWSWIGLRLPYLFMRAIAAVRGVADSTSSMCMLGQLRVPQEVRKEAWQRARSCVVYWAARQGVPVFSPSFADGDIAAYLIPPDAISQEEEGNGLALDLVRDIHSINKMAMTAGCTAMMICGGGVVKHHICNANLMRNGADYTIFLNSGQEFDGSDAGAKPEEALSWGKIRWDGEHVKVCGEVTVVLPLIVAQVFLPAVRQRGETG